MNQDLYGVHRDLEERHWWFRGRRRIMRRLLAHVVPPEQSKVVIDVGCGTGANIASLADQYSCVGIDTAEQAIAPARSHFPAVRFVCGSAPEDLGPLMGQASALLLMDVLEHVPDDFVFFSRLVAALPPGAHVLITVPADPGLWSPHDVSFGHYRRYVPERLARVWAGLPVTVRLTSYYNTRLYPIVKLVRAVNRWRGRTSGLGQSDISMPPKPFNWCLEGLFAGEAACLLACVDHPQQLTYARGVSLVALLRREPGEIQVRHKPADLEPDLHDPQSRSNLLNWTSPARQAGPTYPEKWDVAEKTIIVMPCFNEARRLDLPALEAWSAAPAFELLFVDDGSKDDTATVLDALCRRMHGTGSLFRLPQNQGKAEAVRQGMLHALQTGASITGYLDADLATSLSEMARILDVLDNTGKEVALGSRIRMLGADIQRFTRRHYLGRVFATLASLTLRMPVYDTQCGAKAFRRSKALEAALAEPFLSRWAFDVELLGRLQLGTPETPGLALIAFVEVPLRRWHDIPGYDWRLPDFVRMGVDLFRIRRDLGRRRRLRS